MMDLWRLWRAWRAERRGRRAVSEAWARTPKVVLDPDADRPGTSSFGDVSPHAQTIDGPVQIYEDRWPLPPAT